MEIFLFLSKSRCEGDELESRQKTLKKSRCGTNLVSYDLSLKKNFCTHSTKTLMVGLFLISDKISSTFHFFSVRVDFPSALRFPNSDLFPCLALEIPFL